jgi:hypothetical protein
MTGDSVLDAWVADLAEQLGADPGDLDVQLILDVARDAAHNVMRPAAPLATFMAGYAAALRGGGAAHIADAAATASSAALAWPAKDDS